MNLPVLLALLGGAILWGSAFPLIKVGLEGLSAPHLTLLRHLVASLCFVPLVAFSRFRAFPRWRDVPGFVAVGAVGIALYHLALNAGEQRVSAGAASLIIAAAPAISALLARFFLNERLPLVGWLGSLVSYGGIALIVLSESGGLQFDPYALLILLAALCASIFFVGQKPFLGRYHGIEVTAFATWGATVPLLVFLPGLAGAVVASPPAALAGAYLGVFPSAVAYSLLMVALSRLEVSVVTTFLYTVPVFALLLSWLLLGEVPGAMTVVGGAIAVAGIVVVNLAKRRGTGGSPLTKGSTTPVGGPAAAPRR